jgi:2-polyprenyl-3-methyl-5-hydroxy-6-metoxy-1,4-benzoquinol methylase
MVEKNEFHVSHIENKCCFACGKKNLKTVLDLGDQPLANDYHSGNIEQDKFPLKLNLCESCYHLQLSHTVNPDLMFRHYLYVSGTTKTGRDYFDFFAKRTLEYVPGAKNILDIANNDGTQLDSYQKLGLKTYGIDPATNLYNEAVSKGHEVICDYFNTDTVQKFTNNFDIITAQNVFAHTKYTVDFLTSCKTLMHDDSVLFIQTSQANMVLNNEFDTIYHEHLSFFNTNSMKSLVERCGLILSDVFKTDIHGTSYVFVLSTSNLKPKHVKNLLAMETDLMNPKIYSRWAGIAESIKNGFADTCREYKKSGYRLVGYGAAAKGMTLLNYAQVDLDVVIDDNPLKQGTYSPGRDIPVVGSYYLNELTDTDKVLFVPLAWNVYTEIKTKILAQRTNADDRFLRYFPEVEVEY